MGVYSLKEFKRLRSLGQNVKQVNIVYDKVELECICQYVDTSFDHAFGTHRQGHWEVDKVFYHDILLPFALISEKTLNEIEELCEQELRK